MYAACKNTGWKQLPASTKCRQRSEHLFPVHDSVIVHAACRGQIRDVSTRINSCSWRYIHHAVDLLRFCWFCRRIFVYFYPGGTGGKKTHKEQRKKKFNPLSLPARVGRLKTWGLQKRQCTTITRLIMAIQWQKWLAHGCSFRCDHNKSCETTTERRIHQKVFSERKIFLFTRKSNTHHLELFFALSSQLICGSGKTNQKGRLIWDNNYGRPETERRKVEFQPGYGVL